MLRSPGSNFSLLFTPFALSQSSRALAILLRTSNEKRRKKQRQSWWESGRLGDWETSAKNDGDGCIHERDGFIVIC